MLSASSLLTASLGAGPFFKVPAAEPRLPDDPGQPAVLVPIRSIGPGERERIARHLLDLDLHDRFLRFGYAASDEQVRHYVDSLDFERDEIFGIYNRRLEIIAMAHLAFPPADQPIDCAEFGGSVSKQVRGRGYGARLFDRVIVTARNEGIGMLFIHALSENAAMLKIARKAGATVARTGSEAEAHLQLPKADFDSRMAEIALDNFGEIDFQLKARAMQFWGFLHRMQAIRRGARSTTEHTES
ncbi:GNAT family protein [Variovorax humicola]|uniref:GNAT family protein n=1 Tax=Variovorax humicola TaxID=1769758 RepID=A0ABU8W1F1_9BURK